MAKNAENKQFLSNNINKSMSCSHAGVHRWKGIDYKHCGYCLPCIIRRAAMYKASIDLPSEYVVDIINDPPDYGKKSGRDIKAVLMAIEEYSNSKKATIFKILESGPIPGDYKNKAKYSKVYENGIEEINSFIMQR